MKKLLLTSLLTICCAVATMAVPAWRGTTTVQQPDGSSVTLQLLGDEWRHFHATADGYSVVKDRRGYYVYAELRDGRLEATALTAHDADSRSAEEQAFLAGTQKYLTPSLTAEMAARKSMTEGREASRRASRREAQYDYQNFRGLVILVQFNDREFSRTDYHDIADAMLNKENFDGYAKASGIGKESCTGSVRDYFSDNSGGKFKPQFDVYGPVTIDYSQYDAKGTDNSQELTLAAINAADEYVNFADYDRDGDGAVDMIYFIFAGYGANYSGNDDRLFWPHRYYIRDRVNNRWTWGAQRDGVTLWDYASSVELYGIQGRGAATLDGIGTICHEFGHVLGLPDFYDTDYEQNGQSLHPDIWSVMAGGSYENYGRTPVGYSLYERIMVGFIDEPETIAAAGRYTLDPVATSLTGLKLATPVKNENFYFENRQTSAFKWDRYLPGSGMLVYRVDLTNTRVWDNNSINDNPDHNYYELVRAGGASYASTGADPFPGTRRVTELHNGTTPANLKTWAGKNTKWGLFNIKSVNGVISFDVEDVLTLQSLTLPEEPLTVGVGVTQRLTAVAEPDYAEYTLTWESSDTDVATVDEEGRVTGVSVGVCTITVTSDNGISASCDVNVVKMDILDVADFKMLFPGEEGYLNFMEAEVIYAKGDVAYVRDLSGAIILSGAAALELKANDRMTGVMLLKFDMGDDLMPYAVFTENTDPSAVSVTAGSEVKPREVTLGELTPDDYADYVLVKAARLETDKELNRVFAVSGNRRVVFYNKLGLKVTMPKNYNGNYFDLPVIYGTDQLNGKTVDELYLFKTPTQVEAPTDGISDVRLTDGLTDGPLYNMQGQRVDRSFKGIVIQGGKKYVSK